jgi:putative holliday junction resolvase
VTEEPTPQPPPCREGVNARIASLTSDEAQEATPVFTPLPAGRGAGGVGSSGALLGIDYGTKRIGLAVCDPDRVVASPLSTTSNDSGTFAFFTELVARSKFVGIVVGLPLHANGDESDMSRHARAFAKRLAELTQLPVVMWDERCTSAAAESALLEAKLNWKKRKGKVDRVAAQMILQSFLDAKCPAGGTDALFTEPSPNAPPPDATSN